MELRKHKYRDLATNTLIFTISSFASKLLVFFLVPLYTSVLSTEEYGFADLISTTASLLIFILTLNISDSVLRFAIDRTEGQENILSYGLKIQINGTILLSVVLLIIDRLHVFVIDSYYYIFLLLLFFFNAIHQTASNYLRAINKLKAVAISGVVQTLTIICSNIFFLLVLKIGVKGYILSILLGSIVSTLYSFLNFDTSLLVIIKSKCDKSTRNEMIKYSVPLIFNSVAWWMNNSIDKYFLISILNASANGLYAVSYKIPSILTMVNQIFAQAWSLSAIKEFDKNDKDGFFAQIYSLYNATMVICCSILIILNVFLARIMYAKDFFDAWNYTSPLLISIIFSALSSFIGSIFAAVKNSKIFAVSTVGAAFINILFNAILIPIIGVQGAAIATAISFFSIWAIRLVCVRKYIKLKINIKRDAFSYVLLGMQAIIEHYNNHNYIIQFAIIMILLFLYRNEMGNIINKIESIIKIKRNEKK